MTFQLDPPAPAAPPPSGPPAKPPTPRWVGITAICITGVIVVAIAIGMMTHKTAPTTVGKYDQTWAASMGDTSCSQWLHSMDAHQRFVASHQMVIALSAKDTSDTFAASFVGDVDTGCSAGVDLKVAEVAASIATIATGDFN